MKLSTRKELLNYADSVLGKIRENIKDKTVNEIDWEEHEKWVVDAPTGYSGTEKSAAHKIPDFILRKKLREIEDKYWSLPRNTYTPQQKQEEINEMLRDIEIVRQHLNQPRVRIPRDPRQQTELQKILVNKPSIDILERMKDPTSIFYKDPKTGLLWNYNLGAPEAPYEWTEMYLRDYVDSGRFSEDMKKLAGPLANNYLGVVEWDESRGWLWNIWNKLFRTGV